MAGLLEFATRFGTQERCIEHLAGLPIMRLANFLNRSHAHRFVTDPQQGALAEALPKDCPGK